MVWRRNAGSLRARIRSVETLLQERGHVFLKAAVPGLAENPPHVSRISFPGPAHEKAPRRVQIQPTLLVEDPGPAQAPA